MKVLKIHFSITTDSFCMYLLILLTEMLITKYKTRPRTAAFVVPNFQSQFNNILIFGIIIDTDDSLTTLAFLECLQGILKVLSSGNPEIIDI